MSAPGLSHHAGRCARLLPAVLAVLSWGCASAVSGFGDAGGSGPDAADGPPRAGADAMPAGAISFFKTPICPNGWFPYGPAVGRFLLPVVGSAGIGATRGTPLQAREERTHTHALAGSVDLHAVSYAGIVGEANHNLTAAGAAMLSTLVDPAPLGLPYVQLLVCQKSAPPRPSRRPVPPGTLAFFGAAPCPDGWDPAGPTQGRFLVGLPDRGSPGVSFGGAPLGEKDQRTHTHAITGSVNLPSYGVALASGCCGGGFAQAGMYSYSATSMPDDGGVPTLQLLQCQKL